MKRVCGNCEDRQFFETVIKTLELIRHGHWTEQPWADEEYGRLISNYECSVCKVWSREDYDYCPNCGAKMINERR